MPDTHRWSELFPAHTALSFAAMWDPKEGMVTFSGLHLLDSDLSPDPDSDPSRGYTLHRPPRFQRTLQDYAPRDAVDTQSQVLTIDLLANALMCNTPNTDQVIAAIQQRDRIKEQRRGPVTFALNDHGSMVDPYWRRNMRTQYEDDLESEDSFYSEEQELDETPTVESKPVQDRMKAIGSFLLAAARTPLDGRIFGRHDTHSRTSSSSGQEEDSGFFEEVPLTATGGSHFSAPLLVNLNLKSAFSMTTTSTTNYVDVDRPSVCQSGHHHRNEACDASEVWSTLRDIYNPPDEGGGYYMPTSSPYGFPITHRRRLRKPRIRQDLRLFRPEPPAKPEEVLAREEYNHETPPSPSTPSIYSQASLATPSLSPPPTLRKKKSFAKAKKVILDKLTKCTGAGKEEDGYHGWVCVDITKKVTQRVLH